MTRETAEEKRLRRQLRALTAAVEVYLASVDAARRLLPGDRAKTLLQLRHDLERANLTAQFEGLGMRWENGVQVKPAPSTNGVHHD
jgi:hypothetical protein